MENGIANCDYSDKCTLILLNFGPQAAKNRTEFWPTQQAAIIAEYWHAFYLLFNVMLTHWQK